MTRPALRRWSPVLTGLAGAALTLAAALWLDVRAAQSRLRPEPPAYAPTTIDLATDSPQFTSVDLVFPFERSVIHGDTQWLPLLLQLGDPEFLADDKRTCIAHLAAMPEDEHCRVEYAFWLDSNDAGRVRGVQARVTAGDPALCRAYVECRLPGLASARLDVPASELGRHPSGLRITDRVTHAPRRPSVADEDREISDLTKSLATPDHLDLVRMPIEVQRLQAYRRQQQARRLEALQQRRQRR